MFDFQIIGSASSATGGSYVEMEGNSSSYVEWNVDVPITGKYLISFRAALDTSPKPLSIVANGDVITSQPANSIANIVNFGGSPAAEHFPLQRCEGE